MPRLEPNIRGGRCRCSSAAVKQPGLVEVPFGLTLRDMLDHLAVAWRP
ncbi:MAG: hypothetical protein U0231_03610 [Nitrospiraceae bacterium]